MVQLLLSQDELAENQETEQPCYRLAYFDSQWFAMDYSQLRSKSLRHKIQSYGEADCPVPDMALEWLRRIVVDLCSSWGT